MGGEGSNNIGRNGRYVYVGENSGTGANRYMEKGISYTNNTYTYYAAEDGTLQRYDKKTNIWQTVNEIPHFLRNQGFIFDQTAARTIQNDEDVKDIAIISKKDIKEACKEHDTSPKDGVVLRQERDYGASEATVYFRTYNREETIKQNKEFQEMEPEMIAAILKEQISGPSIAKNTRSMLDNIPNDKVVPTFIAYNRENPGNGILENLKEEYGIGRDELYWYIGKVLESVPENLRDEFWLDLVETHFQKRIVFFESYVKKVDKLIEKMGAASE